MQVNKLTKDKNLKGEGDLPLFASCANLEGLNITLLPSQAAGVDERQSKPTKKTLSPDN